MKSSRRPSTVATHADHLPTAEFIPVIGDLIVSSMEGRLSAQEKSYWSFRGDVSRIDKSRGEHVPVRKILPPARIARM